jgi:hypothetical protein
MKNKTIQILTKGDWTLPIGTKVNTYADKSNPSTGSGVHTVDEDTSTYFIDSDNKGPVGHIYEVDFSDVPKLYPSKGMEVGKEGVEFADGDGKLLDVGVNGFVYALNNEDRYVRFGFDTEKFKHFQLKRTLPKTKTVCAECHKGVCECAPVVGLHRVRLDDAWYFRYWTGTCWSTHKGGGTMGPLKTYCEIEDKNNPINVIPESEVKS